jgi:hypothetical protein
MNKRFMKFSTMLVLALVISVFASISALAASEVRVDVEEGNGQYITISNVVEEKALDFDVHIDPYLVAQAPVTVKFDGGSFFHQYISYSTNFKLYEGSVAMPSEEVQFDVHKYVILGEEEIYDTRPTPDIENGIIPGGASGNYATLTKPGYYLISATASMDYDQGTMFLILINGEGVEKIINETEPEPEPEPVLNQVTAVATPTASKILIDSKEVAFQAYNINGNNYFKLRDLAMVVNGTDKNFEVSWDAEKNAVNLLPGKAYTPAGGELEATDNIKSKDAILTSSKLYVNGIEVQLTAYNIGGNNYFKLRDIATAINFGVTWDGTANKIGIDTNSEYTVE